MPKLSGTAFALPLAFITRHAKQRQSYVTRGVYVVTLDLSNRPSTRSADK